MEKLASYFDGDNYIQHNPQIPDKLSGLGAALKAMAEKGVTLKYDRIHKVLAQGNFVLTVSEGALGGRHTSFYDLFRVQNGKIAEHWDVIRADCAEGTVEEPERQVRVLKDRVAPEGRGGGAAVAARLPHWTHMSEPMPPARPGQPIRQDQ